MANAQTGFAVVELFTSEGDQRSPAADAVFMELAADAAKSGQPVYFLGYHVDYWNKLGWKDPYSKNQFTFRQENYSRLLPNRDLYTPQLIINGKTELTGRSKEKARAAIQAALSAPAAVGLSLKTDSVVRDTAYLAYSVTALDKNYTLRVALTQDGLSTDVSGGDNAGKHLEHAAVVRLLYSTDKLNKDGQLRIPLKGNSVCNQCKWIGFIQHKQTMQILGAAKAK